MPPLKHLLLLLASFLLPAAAHAAPPKWMTEAMNRPLGLEDTHADAIILHDEQMSSVSSNGRINTSHRHVVRILSRYGAGYAQVAIPYTADTEKVSGFRAWLQLPSGEIKEYKAKDTIDISLSAEAIYSDSRMISFFPYEIEINSIFGYEYTINDRGTHGDDICLFQSDVPTLLSRVSYEIPKGWEIRSTTFNHAPITPQISDREYVWELRNVPAIKKEPAAPPFRNIAAQIGINLIPPPSKNAASRLTFPTWGAIASYYDPFYDKASIPDEAIKQKVNEILSKAGSSQWEQIQAIANYAKNINYVSIALGLGTGGGYIPRNASETFKTNYGDCKDQSTLLLSMFRAAGIKAYATDVYAGYRNSIYPEWPAPSQFNHCIVAVSVDDTVNAPALAKHPAAGQLLFFDPTTNTDIPAGYVPSHLQGSLALVYFPGVKELIQIPFPSPDINRVERNISASILPDGTISAKLEEKSSGDYASYERGAKREGNDHYEKSILAWINLSAPSAKIIKTEYKDSLENNTVTLSVDFSATSYARMMQDKLLVFKPAIVSRRHFIATDSPDRTQPTIISPYSTLENTLFQIPEGFSVDEIPPAIDIKTSFGHYIAKVSVDENGIHYQRDLRLLAADIPPEDYKQIRDFHIAIRKAEQTPVVLIRK